MWAFILFCLSLVITIYLYVKRNKIYDNSENLDNDTLINTIKLDRAFINNVSSHIWFIWTIYLCPFLVFNNNYILLKNIYWKKRI